MPEESNTGLLRAHLKTGTLAEKLVSAYYDSQEEDASEALQKVLATRLAQMRGKLDHADNPPD